MAGTYDFLVKANGANTEYLTISNIPQDYTDLIIVCNMFEGNANVNTYLRMGNGGVASTTIYTTRWLAGSGSTVTTGVTTGATSFLFSTGPLGSGSSVVAGQWIVNIFNYSSTTLTKTMLAYAGTVGTANPGITQQGGFYNSTSAIDTIQFQCQGSNITSDAVFSIYGIKAA